MITRASISHYKSISEANISFGPINVLVGSNGVGKSNIIDALYFLRDSVTEDLDTAITRRHGIKSIRQWSKSKPYNVTIEAEFESSDGRGLYRFALGSTKEGYRVIHEYGEWYGRTVLSSSEDPGLTSFTRGDDGVVTLQTDLSLPKVNDKYQSTVHSSELFATSLTHPNIIIGIVLQRLVEEISSFTAYSIYPNTLREPRVVSRHPSLEADGSNMASTLRRIGSNKSNKESLVESMRVVMPDLVDVFARSTGGYYVPVVSVRSVAGDLHQYNPSQLSDGTLRMLGLLTAFYQPDPPAIIALEEPEQMINPGLLSVVIDAANEFVEYSDRAKRQVFITTHSPTLLDSIDPESIIWTRFSDGVTTCGRIAQRQLNLVKSNLFSPGEIMLSEGFLDQ